MGVRAWRRRPAALAITTALGMALGIAGCSGLTPTTIIDGWSVGAVKSCLDAHCAAQIPVAEAALDRLHPAHPPVRALTIHEEGGYPQADGSMAVAFRSGGCCDVALFEFADGSTLAFGVGYPGISTEPVAVPGPPTFDDAGQ